MLRLLLLLLANVERVEYKERFHKRWIGLNAVFVCSAAQLDELLHRAASFAVKPVLVVIGKSNRLCFRTTKTAVASSFSTINVGVGAVPLP